MLVIDGLQKHFGGLMAVNRVSLTVEPGKIVGLIGPNGSGKSTLVNVVSGLLPSDGGAVRFDGADITGMVPDEIFAQGLVRGFQYPAIYFRMSVLDNTLLPVKGQSGENPWLAPFWGFWRKQEHHAAEDAYRILNDLELSKHFGNLGSDLSGGQMKLLELARTLLGEPKMILLDEPTAGVNPVLARRIFEEIAVMRERLGITFFIIEHRLDILFDFVDEVYVMHMGEIIAHGHPDEVANDPTVRSAYFGN